VPGRDASDPSALISLCCSIHTRTRTRQSAVVAASLYKYLGGNLAASCSRLCVLHRNRFPPTHTHTNTRRAARTRTYPRRTRLTGRSRESATVWPSGGGYGDGDRTRNRLTAAAVYGSVAAARNIIILLTTRAVVVRHPIDLAFCDSRVASVLFLCACVCVCFCMFIAFCSPLA